MQLPGSLFKPKYEKWKKFTIEKFSYFLISWEMEVLLNGNTTSNPRPFDVDISSIRRWANFDEFPRHFHVFFRCNSADRIIHVVSTYFLPHNFVEVPLSEQVFGKWMHFQIRLSLSELQVMRDWLCLRDIAETSLNRLLLFLILKSSYRSCSVEKSILKSFTGKYLCCSLFSKKLQTWRPATQVFFHWNLQNF